MAKSKKQETEEETTGTDVAERKENMPASPYGEDAGAGFEDVTSEDLAIPFISILQNGSPQVDQDAPEYIDGAKPGDIFNSVTLETFDGSDGILFIPVHRHHHFVEWIPRDQGGGFVATYEPSNPMVQDARAGGAFGTLETPDGNDLVETFSVFGLMLDPDSPEEYQQVLIAFSSTQIKHYKRWMTRMRSIVMRDDDGRRFTPPMFAHLFGLTTQKEENKKGKWYGWNIRFNGDNADASRLETDDERYQAAKGFRDLLLEGTAKAAYQTVNQDPEAEDDDTF